MHPLLTKALQLSAELNELAAEQNWQKMENKSRQRHQLLEQYFSISPLPDSHDVIFNVAQEIKKNDNYIEELINTSKRRAISESLDMQSAKRAIDQYQNNAKH